jgi:hypothetical protein
MSVDARPAPRLRTLAEVDAAIERDEALLTQYRFELADLEADGDVTVRARSLVRFVERRLTLLHLRRQSRILARMTEEQRSLLLSGELAWDQLSRGD